jgi:FkbM family methyltransferase
MSYAQRFEDFHLWRCFGEQASGFYVDVGAGHPVYDNVSFAFYLAGWRGICVEPNPALSALSRAVRPRDHHHQVLCGVAEGETTFYMQREFHGLSTGVAGVAQTAAREVGRTPEEVTLPVTTVKALCERYEPAEVDFLKVDVEGAEAAVLSGTDWQRFRPKVVVVEAIEPFTFKPSHADWEPLLLNAGYTFAWTDELNRYYVAHEHRELAARLAEGPVWYGGEPQIGTFGKAAEDPNHPDHRLATLLPAVDFSTLPLLGQAEILSLLTAGIPEEVLSTPVTEKNFSNVIERLFGQIPAPQQMQDVSLAKADSIRALYRQIIGTDAFRAACGRIAASYAW